MSVGLASIGVVVAAAPASAATCDTTWVSTGFNVWNSPTAWSNGVPTAAMAACIPDLGGETVQVATTSPTAASLTIDPNVTLLVEGNGDDGDAKLTIANGGIDNAGHIQLTSNGGAYSAAISVADPGVFFSNGSIEVLPGTGGARSIAGTIQNGGNLTATADADLTGNLINLDSGTVQVGDSTHTANVLSVGALANYQADGKALSGAGTFELFGTLAVPNFDVRVLATRLWLRSAAAQLQATGGANALQHLTTVANVGSLLLDAGTLNTNALTVSGYVRVDAAMLRTAGALTIPLGGYVHLQNPAAVLRPLTGGVRVGQGGSLTGYGQIKSYLRNAGFIETGGPAGQQLTISSTFSQAAAGILTLDVQTTLAGVTPLVVSGTAALGGRLDLQPAPGAIGNGLTVAALTAAHRVGTFRSDFRVLADEQRVLTSYTATRVNLTATPAREDDDVRISYEGWAGKPSTESGRWLRSSSTTGDTMSFAFAGKNVTWYVLTGPDQGQARVAVDGKNPQIVDLYSASANEPFPIDLTAPKGGRHTLQITVTGTKNALSTGTAVTVRGFATPGAGQFDLAAPQVGIGGWTRTTDGTASAGSVRYATAGGRYVQLTFSGNAIDWVTQTCAACGRATVIVDSKVSVVDLYSPAKKSQVVKSFPVTGLGTHTVTIVVLGSKNPKSHGTKVVVDALRPVLPTG